MTIVEWLSNLYTQNVYKHLMGRQKTDEPKVYTEVFDNNATIN